MSSDGTPTPGTPTTPLVTKSQWSPKEWIQVAQLTALVGLLYWVATGKATVDQVDKYLPFLIGQQTQLPVNPSTPVNPGVVVKPQSAVTLDDVNKAIISNNDAILKAFDKLLDDKLKAFSEE